MAGILIIISNKEQLALAYEDQQAYIRNMRALSDEQAAASEVRRYAMIALRDQAGNDAAVVGRANA